VKTFHIRLGGTMLEVAVDDAPGGLRVQVIRSAEDGAGRPRRIDLAEIVPGCYSLLIDGRSHALAVAAWRGGRAGGGVRALHLLFDGVAVEAEAGRSARVRGGAQASGGGAVQVRAPMPGLVVAIQAGPGTAVVPGQPLIIMEAMKMQMEIRAPHAGVVREVRVAPGQDVAGNDLLVTVE
jgi:biotin-dependent enzyme